TRGVTAAKPLPRDCVPVCLRDGAGMGGTEMTTRGTGQNPRPGEQDDEYPGFLWPHDEQDDGEAEEGGRTAPVPAPVPPDGRVPWQWPVPPAVTAVPGP